MEIRDKNAVCLAGEFAVLSQLALRNIDANMTLGRTKSVDILASDPKRKKMYRLEVKTKLRRSGKKDSRSTIFGRVVGGWVMNRKHETIIDASLFYCFVIIWKEESNSRAIKSRFFIVPSNVVARYVREEHRQFLAAHRKARKTIKPNDMRTLRIGFRNEKYPILTPTAEKYENNWEFKS